MSGEFGSAVTGLGPGRDEMEQDEGRPLADIDIASWLLGPRETGSPRGGSEAEARCWRAGYPSS